MASEQEVVVGVRARSVLWYLAFIGFAMNYMIRINMNIAIVDMISDEFKSVKKIHMSECHSENSSFFDEAIHSQISDKVVVRKEYISIERKILDYFEVSCTVCPL